MAQDIQAVDLPHVEHGILVELGLPDPDTGVPTLYRLSNNYTDVVYDGHTFSAVGGLLQVTDIQGDLQSTNYEMSLGLSAILPEYIEIIMGQEIKGGTIKVYRVFYDSETQLIKNINGTDQIFLRFNGIISNYAIQEDIQKGYMPEVSYSITVTASSILAVLENRMSGRRTNVDSYRKYYNEQYITTNIDNPEGNALAPADYSMSSVVALKAASFDFGKPV